jgi:hypothetical protein
MNSGVRQLSRAAGPVSVEWLAGCLLCVGKMCYYNLCLFDDGRCHHGVPPSVAMFR